MTPVGDEEIELRIAEAVEPELFVDEAELGAIRVTRRGARLAPRAIDVVEAVDAEFFADSPPTQAVRLLRRLAAR